MSEILCPNCGKPANSCTCPTLAYPICQRCGTRHSPELLCRPFTRLCLRCGKANTTDHVCIPLSLQCTTCGKPTVEIESCSGRHIRPLTCSSCGNRITQCTCPRTCQDCGASYTGYFHECGLLPLCPRCGRPKTLGHVCPPLIQCPKCKEFYYEGTRHICPFIPICPRCGRRHPENFRCDIVPVCPICGEPKTTNHRCNPADINCPRCGRPLRNCSCFVRTVQKVIPEKTVSKYLEDGWVLKLQLQSGDVIMEKDIDVEKITDTVLEQANKQIAAEIAQADIEKITEKATEKAKKQIEDAITKEKQKLLSE